jgi:hypothetical protein
VVFLRTHYTCAERTWICCKTIVKAPVQHARQHEELSLHTTPETAIGCLEVGSSHAT